MILKNNLKNKRTYDKIKMVNSMTREELNQEIQQELFDSEKKEKKKKIILFLIKLIACLIIFFTLFFAYTTYVSTALIEVREYRITNKKIPDNFNGLKIVQFSDLHYGSTMFEKELKKVVSLTNERKPDIIVFTGDLINQNTSLSSEKQEKIIEILKEMNSSLGKYAILGNEDNEKTETIFNQSGFVILRNEYDFIYNGNNTPILLIGLSSMEKEQDISKAYQYFTLENHIPDIYTVTILHEPDAVAEIKKNHHSDLYLAGHSHNGNIRIPFINTSPFKEKNAKIYSDEFYELGDSKFYISGGLGTQSGIRLFCRPSISFYRLSNH